MIGTPELDVIIISAILGASLISICASIYMFIKARPKNTDPDVSDIVAKAPYHLLQDDLKRDHQK